MPLQVIQSILPEVLILEPRVFRDERGFFFESFSKRDFQTATGLVVDFVQDNHSRSQQHVLRGLHYQTQHPQGKLIRVSTGRIFDVAVDMRLQSSNFGKWMGVELSDENKRQLWVPPGFAHGFLVLSDYADVLYKTTDYWYPEFEHAVLWNDPTLGITWPIAHEPILSTKDAKAKRFCEMTYVC